MDFQIRRIYIIVKSKIKVINIFIVLIIVFVAIYLFFIQRRMEDIENQLTLNQTPNITESQDQLKSLQQQLQDINSQIEILSTESASSPTPSPTPSPIPSSNNSNNNLDILNAKQISDQLDQTVKVINDLIAPDSGEYLLPEKCPYITIAETEGCFIYSVGLAKIVIFEYYEGSNKLYAYDFDNNQTTDLIAYYLDEK